MSPRNLQSTQWKKPLETAQLKWQPAERSTVKNAAEGGRQCGLAVSAKEALEEIVGKEWQAYSPNSISKDDSGTACRKNRGN